MLAVDMGLGKTISTLTALDKLLKSKESKKILIVAPLRVARETWPAEIAIWKHVKHLKYSMILGSAAKREQALKSKAPIHIINRDNLVWLIQYYGKKFPYDTLVLDESQSFKSSSSKRFKTLRKIRPSIDRVIELTGTPAPNGLLDLWSQIYLLDRGERLERTMTHYKNRYFFSDYMGYKWELKPDAEKQIRAKIADICFSMTAADYLELPDRMIQLLPVELPAKTRQFYRKLEREMLAQIEDTEIVTVNAAALSNKLLQCCNGAVYDEDRFPHAVHDAKLDALGEIIENNPEEPILVAYAYKSDFARIQARFGAVGIDGNIEKWNAGKIPLMAVHPASCGHGLNLQHGGHIMVWFGLNWSLELYQQMNARLHRQGQSKPVMLYHIIAKNTIDEVVMKALDGKHRTQKELIDAIKIDVLTRNSK